MSFDVILLFLRPIEGLIKDPDLTDSLTVNSLSHIWQLLSDAPLTS